MRCSFVKDTDAYLTMIKAKEIGLFAEYYNCTTDSRDYGCMRLDTFSGRSKLLFDSLREDPSELMLINYSGSDIPEEEARYIINELSGPMIPAEMFYSPDNMIHILTFHSTDAKEVSKWEIPEFPQSREIQYFLIGGFK